VNTFYFQAIGQQTTNTSHSGGGMYRGRPYNTGGWQYQHIYQVGRDGLTNISVNLLNEAHVNVAIYNVYGQMIQVLNELERVMR
jgi:hypothetical protein